MIIYEYLSWKHFIGFQFLVPACLADEEMTLEEDSIDESRRRAEEEQRRALMEVQRREEEKRATEERMWVLIWWIYISLLMKLMFTKVILYVIYLMFFKWVDISNIIFYAVNFSYKQPGLNRITQTKYGKPSLLRNGNL